MSCDAIVFSFGELLWFTLQDW